MKWGLICVFHMVGLGLVLHAHAQVYDSELKCQETINYYCGPKGEDWEAKRTASLSKECKKRYDWIKDDINGIYSRVCAAKYDFNKTCDYLFRTFKYYYKAMDGKKCIKEKLFCKDFLSKTCNAKQRDEQFLTFIFKTHVNTEECKKKCLEARHEFLKMVREACKEKDYLGRPCTRITKMFAKFWTSIKNVCKKKT